MSKYVLGFQEIDRTRLMEVGGKGANLGELSRIKGIRVPEGFCVTTAAYQRIIYGHDGLARMMDELQQRTVAEGQKIRAICEQIRHCIEETPIPKDVAEEINGYLSRLGEENAYAVRSSATAEDLPNASFAGQQDTFLNIRGKEAIFHHIKKCWASLFTDRAVIYRIQNGFDHRRVSQSIVIQRMVLPQAAGILFTADPVTANRRVLSIDAGLGLGEAMVSGLANADTYKVRDGQIIEKKIATQEKAIYAVNEGGTREMPVALENQKAQTLSDDQILRLEQVGRTIEAHFNCPQDIEWCLSEGNFFVVQSRPITTLYPVPVSKDGKFRVYMSYGHRQMMTDAFKPLGISFFLLLDKWLGRPEMSVAGGRFYKDMSHELSSSIARKVTISGLAQVDVLIQRAFLNLLKRKDLMKKLARGKTSVMNFGRGGIVPMLIQFMKLNQQNDPAAVRELIANNEASVQALRQSIAGKSGDDLFDFINQDHRELTDIMFEPRSVAAAFVGINAVNWVNKNMEKWLGEKNTADILAQAAPNNVISEMGLDLLDVADVVRLHPAVIEYFRRANDETFFEDLAGLEGGEAVSRALRVYLEKYGMHCSGDIDITRPRWSEKPTQLIPLIFADIQNFAPGAHQAKVEQGKREAEQKAQEFIKRLEQLPGGRQKAKQVRRQISVLRNFIGYREYSKHALLQRYYIYKQALLKEAEGLVKKGVIRDREDIYYLSLEEFREVVHTNWVDDNMITHRKAEHEVHQKLTPPRVITSEGEIISGEYAVGSIPKGALVGIPVSSGVIEGRARVVTSMDEAKMEEGDILVTVFTDPSWSPLFVSVKGVVMEIGGVMTHGAVIAREYRLPAVVGVENATKRIRDGQMIRVNGTEGYIEILGGSHA